MDDGASVLHLPLQLERPWEQALNFGSICKETGIYGIACVNINMFLPSERLQLNMLPYDTQAFTGKISPPVPHMTDGASLYSSVSVERVNPPVTADSL